MKAVAVLAGVGLGALASVLVDRYAPLSGPVSKHTFAFRTLGDDGVVGPWESVTNEMREVAPGHFVPVTWTRRDLRASRRWLG